MKHTLNGRVEKTTWRGGIIEILNVVRERDRALSTVAQTETERKVDTEGWIKRHTTRGGRVIDG